MTTYINPILQIMNTSMLERKNSDMKHIEIMNNVKSSEQNLHYGTMPQLLRRVVAISLLALASVGAWAADYVFMQGSNYIIISGGSLTTTTTFHPSTCLWSGTSGDAFTNNEYTLKYSQTYTESGNTRTYSTTLNTSGTNVHLVISADGTIQFSAYVSGSRRSSWGSWTNTNGTWYIQCNGSNVVASTTSSSTNNIKAYLVTTTEIPALTYITGIDGSDAIGLTGTYNYSKIGSAIATTPACTKYTFNSSTYYKLSDNTITTTAPVSSEFAYTWSATCNDATYTGFSINSTTGALSITSLPTTDKTITITLQATKTGQETQTVTKTVNVSNRPPTGIVGGTVYLNDYEDHTWTYYAGVPTTVDGGNYNTNYAGKMYSPDPRNVKITYKANGGAVSIDESETTFVYYKTIEKVGGTYKYQVISNPFSKRPTGKGFGGWKITGGADYIKNKAANATLALDEEIEFENLPYPSVNCTSAEIELTATWVDATIVRNTTSGLSSSGTYETNIIVLSQNYSSGISPSYPCTIMMVEPDGSADYRTYTFTGSITPPSGGIAKIEHAKWNPNGNIAMAGRNLWIGRGVTCSGTNRSVTLAANNETINQVAKIESGSFTSLTHYSSTPSSITKQILVLGNDYDRAQKVNTKLTFSGAFIVSNCNAGNNYQEACRVYSKSGSFMTGISISTAAKNYSYYMSRYTTSGPKRSRYIEIEGGEWYASINGGQDNNGTTVDTDHDLFVFRMRGGKVRGCVYGAAEQTNSSGNRVMVFTGGQVGGWICGASNGTSTSGGVLYGKTFVYFGGDAECNTKYQERTPAAIRNSLGGYVYASGCGSSATSRVGEVTQGTNIVMADNAKVQYGVYGGGAYGYSSGTANVYVTGGHVESSYDASYDVYCGVYGGARQNDGGTVNMYMTGGQIDGVTNSGNHGGGLFGGSNASGTIDNNVKMVVTGGQVGTSTNPANIHGGGYGQPTIVKGNVDVTIGADGAERDAAGPVIYGDVYGGSALGLVNTSSSNHTNVTLNAGTINGSLYGGGLGDNSNAANVNGKVQVTVNGGSVRKTDENGANGSGGVYGCNNINGAPQNNVSVDIYGTNSAPSEDEYAIYAIYGGGNQADYEYGEDENPSVTVHNCDNSIEYIYGGGNAADVPNTYVTIYGGNKIGNVFGGGNGQNGEANVTGEVGTYVMIYGGTIGNVYGGSNAAGSIAGDLYVGITPGYNDDEYVLCPLDIDNVYGGGNQADSKAGELVISCVDPYETFHIGSVYGGANQANITSGNIELNITAGNIDNVFGGNNISGNISGSITVNINDDGSGCGMEVGNVYGGGNLAAYSVYGYNTDGTLKTTGTAIYDDPVVNILSGHITGSVFGGGKGDEADATHATGSVVGNPQVTIGDNSSTNKKVTIDGNVFGGGDAANVQGAPKVVVRECETVIGTKTDSEGELVDGSVYGGGNAADLTGEGNGTDVTIWGGNIYRVFGGGNGEREGTWANIAGVTKVKIYGGTIHDVFGGSNTRGLTGGPAEVTLESKKEPGRETACDLIVNSVVPGGNKAFGNGGKINIGCGTELQDVYGGANNADIGTAANPKDIILNITGGKINRVFGGNNIGGTVYGKIVVNINIDEECGDEIGYVYGGGNQANYTAPTSTTFEGYSEYTGNYPEVNIIRGHILHDVYGGGLGDETGTKGIVTGNPQVKVYSGTETKTTIEGTTTVDKVIIDGNVFGGGHAGKVAGSTNVIIGFTPPSASTEP